MSVPVQAPIAPLRADGRAAAPAVLEAHGVRHRFGELVVLDDVSLSVAPGTIHAILGPNGAGKTTLVRILAGLLEPLEGVVRVAGIEFATATRLYRERVGYIPSGDRSFYLRISGLENLVFFGRLHGLRRSEAKRRAVELLAAVGLEDAARRRVGNYSHGMQKRLAIARVLMSSPPAMLVDEATHDLDPEGARRVRELIAERVADGASVVWVTQRLDEIRGFADTVTLLGGGRVRFAGTVPELMAHAKPRRFVLHLQTVTGGETLELANELLRHEARLSAVAADSAHFVLEVDDGAVLGEALARLTAGGIAVLSCHEEQSEIEEAFVLLTRDQA